MTQDFQHSSIIHLYQDHLDAVYRYHLAHTGNVQDAQDLTSESFRAALEGFDATSRSWAARWPG
jgi:DNA-directed RNA polymerase specialized sigma24 family protein